MVNMNKPVRAHSTSSVGGVTPTYKTMTHQM